MAKGGFLSAVLAERNSSSTSGFAFRSLYYVWLGIPLLFVYYAVFWYVFNALVHPVETAIFRAFGVGQAYTDGLVAQHAKFQEVMNAGSSGEIEAALSGLVRYILGSISGVILLDSLFKLGVMTALYHFGVLDLLLAPVYYITKF